MLAQEEFEVELLLAGNLLEGGVEPLAEDILARLARDELEAVAAQRENRRCGLLGSLLERPYGGGVLVGLQPREFTLGRMIDTLSFLEYTYPASLRQS